MYQRLLAALGDVVTHTVELPVPTACAAPVTHSSLTTAEEKARAAEFAKRWNLAVDSELTAVLARDDDTAPAAPREPELAASLGSLQLDAARAAGDYAWAMPIVRPQSQSQIEAQLARQKKGGFGTEVLSGTRLSHADATAVRASVTAAPAAAVTATATVDAAPAGAGDDLLAELGDRPLPLEPTASELGLTAKRTPLPGAAALATIGGQSLPFLPDFGLSKTAAVESKAAAKDVPVEPQQEPSLVQLDDSTAASLAAMANAQFSEVQQDALRTLAAVTGNLANCVSLTTNRMCSSLCVTANSGHRSEG